MPTTMLGLWASGAENGTLDDRNYNDGINALDRLGLAAWEAFKGGVRSGWTLPATAGKSTVASGQGFVGPVYCRTTVSQVISGLGVGTKYIHAITNSSSARDGGLVFTARATSAVVTNTDGLSTGVLLGKLVYNALTGVTAGSADSTLRHRHWAYQWHRQTLAISLTAASGARKSTSYTFSTAMRLPCVSAVISQPASGLATFAGLTQAGLVAYLYNNKLTGAMTYSKTWTIEGVVRV